MSSAKGYVSINSIVFMNIAALLGVRWFSTAGKIFVHYESMIIIFPLVLIGLGWLISSSASRKNKRLIRDHLERSF